MGKEDIGKNNIIISTQCVDTFGIGVGDTITFQYNDYYFDMKVIGIYMPSFQGGGPPSSNLGIITSVETIDKLRRSSSNKDFNILEINGVKVVDYIKLLPQEHSKSILFLSKTRVNIVGLGNESKYFGPHNNDKIIISKKLAESFGLRMATLLH